jgi:hypothetical protein
MKSLEIHPVALFQEACSGFQIAATLKIVPKVACDPLKILPKAGCELYIYFSL